MREVLGYPHDNAVHRPHTAVSTYPSCVQMSFHSDPISFFWNCSRDFSLDGLRQISHKWDHIVFVLLWLVHFPEQNGFRVHPCSRCQDSLVHYVETTLCSSICLWTRGSSPPFNHCESCSCEHGCPNIQVPAVMWFGQMPWNEIAAHTLTVCLSFWDALPHLHTVFKKAVDHFPLFLYMAEKCSSRIHPVLSIHSFLDGHLSCSWLFAVVNNASKNLWASFCLNIIVISLGYYLGMCVYSQLGNCIIYYEEMPGCCTQTAHFTFPQAKVRGSNSSASLATCDFQFSWL